MKEKTAYYQNHSVAHSNMLWYHVIMNNQWYVVVAVAAVAVIVIAVDCVV